MYKFSIFNVIGGAGRRFEGQMIQLFRYRNVLPWFHSNNNRWRCEVAFNHSRSLLPHCVQISRIRHDLACRLSSFAQNACQENHRLSRYLVMNSGDKGVSRHDQAVRNSSGSGGSWLPKAVHVGVSAGVSATAGLCDLSRESYPAYTEPQEPGNQQSNPNHIQP
jgi:hypothetical protein